LRASGAGIEAAATIARSIRLSFAVVMAFLARPLARLGLRLVAPFTCGPFILSVVMTARQICFGNSFNAWDMRHG
jgi:hypothetical protein